MTTPTMDKNPETLITPSEFTFSITRTAVSQICQNIGFRRTNLSALETLTHIATLYLQTLAKFAASHAADCNRTDSNLFDVIVAFEYLASVQGFRSAAASDQNLLRSTTVTDLVRFVDYNDEVPFAKPIPSFGSSRRRPMIHVMRKKKKMMMMMKIEKRSVAPHVPIWLPPFPDPSSYRVVIRTSKPIDSEQLDSMRNCAENGDELELKSSDFNEDAGTRARRINGNSDENRMMMLPKKRGRVGFKIESKMRKKKLEIARNGLCHLPAKY